MFEPELQATQTAASAQAYDLASGEDDDTVDEGGGDPLPEEELQEAPEGEGDHERVGVESEIEELAYRRYVGTLLLP